MKQCAVYTRVSTEAQAEQEYNSCGAQKDRILSYVRSQEDLEVYKEYSDPGFTGANLDRPAMNELLNDIAEGKIQAVLTYKIDRLTRSTRDFYSLIEFFEKHGVSYVSVTEHFDTSSPSGRLLRNIMLTFAQFEREMIADRVKNSLYQRALKGIWNGGGRPFGYQRDEAKRLVIDKKEAQVVKLLFEQFVMTGSLFKTMKFIRQNNIKATYPECPTSVSGVAYLVRNPLYIGFMKWGDKVYKGQHEAIISQEVFDQAQCFTKKKVIKKRLFKKYLLGGLVKCAECGSGMSHSFTNKPNRRYYYYKCHKVTKEGKDACGIKEINAEKLELFVLGFLNRVANDSHYIENLAFKTVYSPTDCAGFEPGEELVKTLSNAIEKALGDFKEDISKKSQVEKILIFRKVVEKITYSKNSLEVLISLRDKTSSLLAGGGIGLSGRRAAGIRLARQNPTPPFESAGFDIRTGGQARIRT